MCVVNCTEIEDKSCQMLCTYTPHWPAECLKVSILSKIVEKIVEATLYLNIQSKCISSTEMKESKVVLEQFQMRNVRIKNVKYFGQINMGSYNKKNLTLGEIAR